MRLHGAIVGLALVVGVIVYVVAIFLGFAGAAPIAFGIGVLIGAALGVGILMAQNPANIPELVKQIAVWLGLVILLPLVVWYGTSVFSPPPDRKDYSKSLTRLEEQIKEAAGKAEKEKLRQERDRIQDEREDAERVFHHDMFWVAYPLGLAAVIVGTFFPIQAIGAGLMFGGLISLAVGCYTYWFEMDAWLRFISLLIALVVLFALGTWRFRRLSPPTGDKG